METLRPFRDLILVASLALAVTLPAALPAAAGVGGFDLPRLDFPAPGPVTQGCAAPDTLTGPACPGPRG